MRLFALLAPLCLVAMIAAAASAKDVPVSLVSGQRDIAGAAQHQPAFDAIARRMARQAQKLCRKAHPDPRLDCTFTVLHLKDARLGANAFHALDKTGGPVIILSDALLALTQSPDEIAFVIGHEAGHYIAQHDQRLKATITARMRAISALASAADATPATPARSSLEMLRGFEFEADRIGAEIASSAGFDAGRGARLLARPEFQGDQMARASHPSGRARLRALRVSENL